MGDIKKILVSKRRGIGDTILMLPTLEILHKNFPEAAITLLVPESSKSLLELQPGITRIWTFEGNSFPLLLAEIIRERFDFFLDLNSTGQTAWLSRLSLAKRIIHHRHDSATAQKYSSRPNGIEWDIFALKDNFPKLIIPPQTEIIPKIYLWEEEVQHAAEFWRSRGVIGNQVVVLGIGATRATKRWPSQHYARFVEIVRERLNMSIAILIGPGAAEREFANRVIQDINALHLPKENSGAFIVEQISSLRNFAALLSRAHSFVGNDSGPKHIAVAVGTPTLTFFGPEDPQEWHPYPFEAHPYLFINGLPCRKQEGGRWCDLQECIVEKHRCMVDMSPQNAFQAFMSLKRRPGIHDTAIVVTRPPLPTKK